MNIFYLKYDMNENEYLQNSFKILKFESLNSFNELRIKRERKS
jgi:hypothetical protein